MRRQSGGEASYVSAWTACTQRCTPQTFVAPIKARKGYTSPPALPEPSGSASGSREGRRAPSEASFPAV